MSTSVTSAVSAAVRPGSPLAELKIKQQQIWSSGDYNKIAAITVPVAESLVAHAGVRPGAAVLDVATGTGHAALAAARQSAEVTGVDYVPRLIEIAVRRAAAEELPVDYRVADAEELPFADESFDYVLSAIGVMFTADHARAAAELVRVCRPGGRIVLASWTPTGFVGQLLKTVGRHVPPPPVAQSPTRWGSEDGVREIFGPHAVDAEFVSESVRQRFASPEAFADLFLDYYGPTHKAAKRLDADGRRALRADMVGLAETFNQASDGTFVGEWQYLVASLIKR
jgi:SAM-dependent methyltransferase